LAGVIQAANELQQALSALGVGGFFAQSGLRAELDCFLAFSAGAGDTIHLQQHFREEHTRHYIREIVTQRAERVNDFATPIALI